LWLDPFLLSLLQWRMNQGPHPETPDTPGDGVCCGGQRSLLHHLAPFVWHAFEWLA